MPLKKEGQLVFCCCCKRDSSWNGVEFMSEKWLSYGVIVLLHPSMCLHPSCERADIRANWRNRNPLSTPSAEKSIGVYFSNELVVGSLCLQIASSAVCYIH